MTRAHLLPLLLLVGGCSTLPEEPKARGAVVFENCVACHGENGQGNQLALAPNIAGLPEWYVRAQLDNFQVGRRGSHPDDLSGLRMRPMSRTLKSQQDFDAVVAHVSSLPYQAPEKTLQGDAAKGEAAYATCAACHGADGKGNEAMHAPPIRQLDDWYVVTQLSKFKAGHRGYAADDTWGAQMRGMANTVVDEAAARDLAAYLSTLGAK